MSDEDRTIAVLEHANRVHGRSWRFVGALDGGWQSGASRIEDSDGPAVLKWSDRTWWAPRVLGAKAMVDHARWCGYPTPAWLAVGTTSEGFGYQVQEFVVGEPMGGLDDVNLAAVIEIGALQRTIELDTAVDWTNFMCGSIFDDSEGYRARLAASGGAVAEVARAAAALAAPHRSANLVHSEMVHGDLSTANILMRDGEIVAVIDIEALGRGCASFDLLAPARQDYVWGDWQFGGALIEEVLRRDGEAFACIAVAADVINILAFGLDHWAAGDVEGAATSLLGWIDDVRSAVV